MNERSINRPTGASGAKEHDGGADKRKRLGLVLPSVNTVVEPWFNAVAPEGVTFHAARMLLDSNLTADAVRRMDREEGLHAVEQLVSCKPAAIAYCCTASSVIQGVPYDDVLIHEIERVAKVPAVTATRAITRGLELLGARRLAVASPYTDEIDAAEHRFFTDCRFRHRRLGAPRHQRLILPGGSDSAGDLRARARGLAPRAPTRCSSRASTCDRTR